MPMTQWSPLPPGLEGNIARVDTDNSDKLAETLPAVAAMTLVLLNACLVISPAYARYRRGFSGTS